jgi:hypothetical protein
MSESRQNFVIGVMVIIGAGFLFGNTFYFPAPIKPEAPGPAFFPRIILVILLILGAFLFLSGLFSRQRVQPSARDLFDHRKFLIASASVIIYLILLPYLGFILDSFLYMSFSLLNRVKGYVRVIAIAAISSGCLYGIFAWLLNVRLPQLF